MKRLVLGCLVTFLCAPALSDVLAITNARVHTLTDRGALDAATVIVRNGRVAAVGIDVELPETAVVIDAEGGEVTPGFMVGFSTIGLAEVDAVDQSLDMYVEDGELGAAFSIARAVNPDSVLFGVARAGGITHALVGPYPGVNLFAGRASVIRLGGGGDPVVAQDLALLVAVGQDAGDYSGGSRAAALQLLERGFEEAARVAAGEDAEGFSLPLYDLEVLGEVLAAGGRVGVFANRATDIRHAVDILTGLGLSPVILGGAEAWKVADRLAEADVPVIFDPLENTPQTYDSLGARLDNAVLLHEAGVRFAFLEWSAHEIREIRQYAGNAVAEGVPYEVALGALTGTPAEIWGLAGRGTIEAGAPADLVVWSGDPLELTSWAETVVLDGEVVPHDSRQLMLQERYRDPRSIYQTRDAPRAGR